MANHGGVKPRIFQMQYTSKTFFESSQEHQYDMEFSAQIVDAYFSFTCTIPLYSVIIVSTFSNLLRDRIKKPIYFYWQLYKDQSFVP